MEIIIFLASMWFPILVVLISIHEMFKQYFQKKKDTIWFNSKKYFIYQIGSIILNPFKSSRKFFLKKKQQNFNSNKFIFYQIGYSILAPYKSAKEYFEKRKEKINGPYRKFVDNLQKGLNDPNYKIRRIAEKELAIYTKLGKKYFQKNLMKNITERLNDPSTYIRTEAFIAFKHFYQQVECC